MLGLVNMRNLSEEAVSFGRTAGMALLFESQSEKSLQPLPFTPIGDAQSDLFQLFAQLFSALTGRAVELVSNEQEIQDRMLWRFKHEHKAMADATKGAVDELVEFYSANVSNLFQHAKTLGGMRLVTGGQRTFGISALSAVRITGLYADTQLIPDPVYPFLTADLQLNAMHYQLALVLFHILQLRPLVDARLPVPPVFVFPSFEEALEKNDPYTKHGIEQLFVRMVSPVCNGSVASVDEMVEYSIKHGNFFTQSLLASGLFIPPGAQPGQQFDVTDAVKAYFDALVGVRSRERLEEMKTWPTGMLLLNCVLERVRPHFHLLENATEFGAQPLLSQSVHWHYFEKCAQANAEELLHKSVLSMQAFQTLRSVQDDSLSWLATIPISTLAKLIANDEHRWLREELNRYTAQLAGSAVIDTNDMVREVSFGLASLVQRQQKAMSDIERKYTPKKMAAYVSAGSGLAVAATAAFLPMLAPLLGVGVPIAAATAAAGGGILGFGKEKIGELVEKRQAERSMLGVLATVRPR